MREDDIGIVTQHLAEKRAVEDYAKLASSITRDELEIYMRERYDNIEMLVTECRDYWSEDEFISKLIKSCHELEDILPDIHIDAFISGLKEEEEPIEELMNGFNKEYKWASLLLYIRKLREIEEKRD